MEYIQVGFTSMRDPATGNFLPAVPLFIEATEEAKESEAAVIKDIGSVFADKMKQYIDAGGMVGSAAANTPKKRGRPPGKEKKATVEVAAGGAQ